MKCVVFLWWDEICFFVNPVLIEYFCFVDQLFWMNSFTKFANYFELIFFSKLPTVSMNFFAKLANWFEWILLQSCPTFLNKYFCKVANCFNEYFCKVGQLYGMNILQSSPTVLNEYFDKLVNSFEWICLDCWPSF